MAISLSDSARTNMATGLRDTIDAGSGPGYVEIRTGSKPASVATGATGTLLATVTLADPSGTVATGVLSLSGLPRTDTAADNTGTAGWFRVYDSTGAAVLDGTCSGTGGGGDMVLDNASLVTGQSVSIVAVSSFTMPAS